MFDRFKRRLFGQGYPDYGEDPIVYEKVSGLEFDMARERVFLEFVDGSKMEVPGGVDDVDLETSGNRKIAIKKSSITNYEEAWFDFAKPVKVGRDPQDEYRLIVTPM